MSGKLPTGGALAGGVVTYEAGAFGALGLPSVVILALPQSAR